MSYVGGNTHVVKFVFRDALGSEWNVFNPLRTEGLLPINKYFPNQILSTWKVHSLLPFGLFN